MKKLLILLLVLLFVPSTGTYCPKIDGLELVNTGFTINFDESSRIPKFVYYEVERSKCLYTSRSSFYADKRTPYSAAPNDYAYSGYDRGHVFPVRLTNSLASNKECMIMTNMVPQTPHFNRGLWKRLETFEYNNSDPIIFVVSGCIYSKDDKFINGIRVPNLFYKVIYHKTYGMIAYLVSQSSEGNIREYVKTVDEIENITKIDFFYQLPDNLESKLESQVNIEKWNW